MISRIVWISHITQLSIWYLLWLKPISCFVVISRLTKCMLSICVNNKRCVYCIEQISRLGENFRYLQCFLLQCLCKRLIQFCNNLCRFFIMSLIFVIKQNVKKNRINILIFLYKNNLYRKSIWLINVTQTINWYTTLAFMYTLLHCCNKPTATNYLFE